MELLKNSAFQRGNPNHLTGINFIRVLNDAGVFFNDVHVFIGVAVKLFGNFRERIAALNRVKLAFFSLLRHGGFRWRSRRSGGRRSRWGDRWRGGRRNRTAFCRRLRGGGVGAGVCATGAGAVKPSAFT